MISPSLRAIFLMLLGLPILVAIALLAPELWIVSAGWIAGVGALIAVDTLLGASVRHYSAKVNLPPLLYVGSAPSITLLLAPCVCPPPPAGHLLICFGSSTCVTLCDRAAQDVLPPRHGLE